jgi:hypothetical protein
LSQPQEEFVTLELPNSISSCIIWCQARFYAHKKTGRISSLARFYAHKKTGRISSLPLKLFCIYNFG